MARLKLSDIVAGLVLTACTTPRTSTVDVTHGIVEPGFPQVVRIVMSGGGSCTGTFVSDTLLLTAAHCVHRASSVTVGSVTAAREHFFIHPSWPVSGVACDNPREPKYDVALVRFPVGTYAGGVYGRLSPRAPIAGETLKIVGYGNNLITPFAVKFCKLPERRNDDGVCVVEAGEKVAPAKYTFSDAFKFNQSPNEAAGVGCPADCDRDGLKAALAAEGGSFESFVAANCDGNFRDRPYQESGSGTKRSGSNVVSEVTDGTIRFVGGLGGDATGEGVASGAGDSGGPLFIDIDGQWQIAGVTHGGSLYSPDSDSLGKRSSYVDLNAEFNRAWLSEVVNEAGLDFPDLVAP